MGNDWYLEDRTRLRGQPKRTIADYVEQNGILVPRRFDSFEEAKKSGLPIIARSEHEQDYDGVSGLLTSPFLQDEKYKDAQNEEELKERVLEEHQKEKKTFCKLTKYDETKFKQEVSFSFWEFLSGYNLITVADSSIRERYHLMVYPYSPNKHTINYTIVEGGTLIQEFINPLTAELRAGLKNLIELYERIRNLPNFNPNHCPIMEFQTCLENGKLKNYFLQYHRTRDFEPVTFKLERALEKGEIEVPFVRGATQKEREEFKVIVYYAYQKEKPFYPQEFQLHDEEGSLDFDRTNIESELMTRKRKLQIIESKDKETTLLKAVEGHIRKSQLFNPKISVVMQPKKLLLSGETWSPMFIKALYGEEVSIKVHLTSDGRKAYIRRVD